VGKFVGKNFPAGVLLVLEWSTKPLLYPTYPNYKSGGRARQEGGRSGEQRGAKL
jgi:hypothetical protein